MSNLIYGIKDKPKIAKEWILYCNKLFALELINKIVYNKVTLDNIRDEGYFGKYKGFLYLYIIKELPTDRPCAVII